MALANSLDNFKDVGIYSFNTNDKGNIEINFKADKTGEYKLILTETDLRKMFKISKLTKML